MRKIERFAKSVGRQAQVLAPRVLRTALFAAAVVVGSLGLPHSDVARASHNGYNCYPDNHQNCVWHKHTHHQHWHYGVSLADAKKTAVAASADRWTNAPSEWYFFFDAASENHAGEHAFNIPTGDPANPAHEHFRESECPPCHILGGDFHYNSDYNGTWYQGTSESECPGPGDLYSTLGSGVHERGHIVGLIHVPDSVTPWPSMVGGHNPKCWAQSLENGDRAGLEDIYDNSPGD